MKPKLNLDGVIVSKLQSVLLSLKAHNGNPLKEITEVLGNTGITWDKVIAAREKGEPNDFFCLFKKYHEHKTIEWYPICRNLDIELLASLLSHEANNVSKNGNTNKRFILSLLYCGVGKVNKLSQINIYQFLFHGCYFYQPFYIFQIVPCTR
jgi:hypothetical protein